MKVMGDQMDSSQLVQHIILSQLFSMKSWLVQWEDYIEGATKEDKEHVNNAIDEIRSNLTDENLPQKIMTLLMDPSHLLLKGPQ